MSHIPDNSTQSEDERTRSQTHLPRSKSKFLTNIKGIFSSKKKPLQHAVPDNQASPSHPRTIVNAPQDGVSSTQGFPPNQHNAPDPATAGAALETASGALSAMGTPTGKIKTVVSTISKVDNPIALVDSVSSFLKTLSKFNNLVDKIATVHFYAKAAWTVLSSVSKVIIDQTTRDDAICALLSKMDEVYTFLNQQELQGHRTPPNGPYFGWAWLGYTVSVSNGSPEQVPTQFTADSGRNLIMDTKKPKPESGIRVTSNQQLGLGIARKLEISIAIIFQHVS